MSWLIGESSDAGFEEMKLVAVLAMAIVGNMTLVRRPHGSTANSSPTKRRKSNPVPLSVYES